MVNELLDADIDKVPEIVKEMKPYRLWAVPRLRDADVDAEKNNDSRQQLHVSLGLLPADAGQVEYLYGRLLDAEPQEVGVIVGGLSGYKGELTGRLWAVVDQPEKGHEGRRLRAAAALAAYDPDSQRWDGAAGPVVEQLVSVSPIFLADWMKALRPVREKLQVPLEAVFRDRAEDRAERAEPGHEHPGRLCRRQAGGPGRSAHGRRREAVRRAVPQGGGELGAGARIVP